MARKPTARESLYFFIGLTVASGVWMAILLNTKIRQNERFSRALNRIAALEVSVEGLAAMTAESQPAQPRAEQVLQSLAEAFSTDVDGIAKLAAMLKEAGRFALTTGQRGITIEIVDLDLSVLSAALDPTGSKDTPTGRIRGTLTFRVATQASRPSTRPRGDDAVDKPTRTPGVRELMRRREVSQRLREIAEGLKAYAEVSEPYPALSPTTLPGLD